MPTEKVNTVQLNDWVDRMRAGDLAARDELLRGVGNRLERLARKMLGKYPSVRRWAQTDDVLQSSVMRLLRALEQIRPDSVRGFFGLAAEQMRRELLDLARHFYGPHGQAAHHETWGSGDASRPALLDVAERSEPADEQERWSLFHEAVNKLSDEEREIVGLVYYHGWTQQAVAELLGVSVRTIQRRRQLAMLKLHAVIKRTET